jgi:hypothetical protein
MPRSTAGLSIADKTGAGDGRKQPGHAKLHGTPPDGGSRKADPLNVARY